MIIKEGSKVPFGFGLVGVSPVHYRGMEVQPVPFNYVKKWWYKVLRDTKLTDLDQQIANAQETGYKQGFTEGYDQAPIDFKRLEEKIRELGNRLTPSTTKKGDK